MDKVSFTIVIAIIICSFMAGYSFSKGFYGINTAIQQCEAELPRHQSCRVVISAEVNREK